MADSQVEAMRKAYAGIMLNMAQESAARVLAAERRAAALAAGLEAAKDDGVAALLRLKAIMDAKVKEVELESSAHVKRIKELEEQLHGAQNTMASLKVELHLANNELERTRKTLAEARINSLPTSKEADSNKGTGPRSEIHQQGQGGNILLKNKKNTDDCGEACLVPIVADNGAVEKLDINRCSPDLPSFMERNKKPKFYHNGCTQRIHALKQRTKGTVASLKQNPKQVTTLNSCSKTRKNNAAKNPCHTRSIMEEILQTKFLGKYKGKRGRRSRPSCKHDNSSEHGVEEDKLSDTSGGNGCLLLIQALEQELSPPKMSAGQGVDALTDMKEDLKISRRDAGLNQGTAFPELLDVLAVNNMQVKKRKRTKTIRVMEDELSDSKSVPGSANTLLRTTSEKSVSDNELISEVAESHSDTSAKNNGPPLKFTTENCMHQTGVDNGQFEPENSSAVLLQSTKSEPIDYGNLVVDQLEQITPNTDTASCKEVLEDGSCTSASQKADASTVSSLNKEENLKASSGLPMQALEKPDASIAISLNKEEDAKTASGLSMQAEGARHIKYTFNRRKRKCVSIYSTPQRAVPETSSDLGSPPKKQNPRPNPVMQEHPVGSPKRDNHLVHIAQQLILLSENK